jgi:hypothetical protein
MQRLDRGRQDKREQQGEGNGDEGHVRFVKQQAQGADDQQSACIHRSRRPLYRRRGPVDGNAVGVN